MKIGEKFLITTDEWFYAPDGNSYRSVHGTVKGIFTDKEALGIETNRHSSNWYVQIGNMIVAGCQIHYVTKTDDVDLRPPKDAEDGLPRIYVAD